MANGFSLGLLQHVSEVAKTATPQYKLEPVGLLASLKFEHSPAAIKYDSYDGHFKTVKIKYKQRFTKDQTVDAADCENVLTQPYLESTVSVDNYRQIAIHLQDETVAAFDKYASNPVSVPGSDLSLMWEMWDSVMSAASALMESINDDLGTLAVAGIGAHRATGNANAVSVNIPLATTSNPLNGGVNKVKSDWLYNNFAGTPIVVGAGLFHQWMLNQPAKGLDSAGVDSRIQAAGFKMYVDYALASVLANGGSDVIVYEKDAIQLVEYMVNRGHKSGDKMTSIFGRLPLPMKTGDGSIKMMEFDYQLKYNDCEKEFGYVDGVEGQVLQRGWNLIISKRFGLWTIPTNAYRAADGLTGNRGSLRYRFTNT